MKKNLVLIIVLMAIQMVSAQTANITLLHDGKFSVFNTDKLQTAIDASMEGDTIYLGNAKYTEGPYVNRFIITKRISIIGQGEKSQLGEIELKLPNGTDMSSSIFTGINASGGIYIYSPLSNIHIDKCSIGSFILCPCIVINNTNQPTNEITKNVLVERCNINSVSCFDTWGNIENMIVSNSRIERCNNTSDCINCINDSIGDTSPTIGHELRGNYTNCIFRDFSNTSSSCSFINCLMKRQPSYGTVIDCYLDTKTDYTSEELFEKGYLGTDGTIVGCYGGYHPYNIIPSVPSFENLKIQVNYNTKKINISGKVIAN